MSLDLGDLDKIDQMVRNGIEAAVRAVREDDTPVQLGGRWQGGKMVLVPQKDGQAAKEIPIETFFHKIVMVRDRLRVLEQRINAHTGLSDEDKVELQQYVTRCYGSLTTFNVLFREKADHFTSGAGGETP